MPHVGYEILECFVSDGVSEPSRKAILTAMKAKHNNIMHRQIDTLLRKSTLNWWQWLVDNPVIDAFASTNGPVAAMVDAQKNQIDVTTLKVSTNQSTAQHALATMKAAAAAAPAAAIAPAPAQAIAPAPAQAIASAPAQAIASAPAAIAPAPAAAIASAPAAIAPAPVASTTPAATLAPTNPTSKSAHPKRKRASGFAEHVASRLDALVVHDTPKTLNTLKVYKSRVSKALDGAYLPAFAAYHAANQNLPSVLRGTALSKEESLMFSGQVRAPLNKLKNDPGFDAHVNAFFASSSSATSPA